MKDTEEITNAQAMGQIAQRGGPKAVELITQLMDQSARERESIERFLYESLERERDEWRERALEAEARLARIKDRVWDLLS